MSCSIANHLSPPGVLSIPFEAAPFRRASPVITKGIFRCLLGQTFCVSSVKTYPILLLKVVNLPRAGARQMPPKCSIGQGLTWSWAYSTGHPASDQRLDAAAKAAWSYAVLCAWTYLNDLDSAHDLMDLAVQKAAGYAARHPDSPPNKLTTRIKSALRRRAKQLAGP